MAAPYCLLAQLCGGSLGDPVVNITFGSGTSYGPALAAATTNYKYITNSCPENGYYTLVNKGVECNYGWHVLPGDHTGDANGYFMLVDASFETSDFYIDTVTNLCANTTYEFAAWMLNLKYIPQGSRPNITFSIETTAGQVLQTYNSGDIPVERTIQWKKYGFFFTTPSDLEGIVLRMTNNAPGGDGNDLALDDITFRPCGKLITVNITGSIKDTIDICEGNSNIYLLNAGVAAGYISPVYQWQTKTVYSEGWKDIDGATSTVYTRQPTDTGSFLYRFAVAEATTAGVSSCRIASRPVTINVHAKPAISAGPDRLVLRGNSITINATATGNTLSYFWTPGSYLDNVAKLTPAATPQQDIGYTLSASSVYGCTSTDEVSVKVINGMYIPTAFSPNNDGKNDSWKISFIDAGSNASVQVYNRLGQRVYVAENKIVNWDGSFKGQPLTAGTYIYFISFKENALKLKGAVTLVR